VRGDTVIPGGFAASDVTMVVDGSLGILPDTGAASSRHVGVGFHASKGIEIGGVHSFQACGRGTEPAATQSSTARQEPAASGPALGHLRSAARAAATAGAGGSDPGLELIEPSLLVIRHVEPGNRTTTPPAPAPTKPKTILVADAGDARQLRESTLGRAPAARN
jgi:hypothetical protein